MRPSLPLLCATALLAILPALARALAVDGTPSFNSQTDTGLYVWRAWNGDWQARVMAATGPQRVTGAFQSEQAMVYVRRLSLEADDVLRISSERTTHLDLRTAQRTVDGLIVYAGDGDVCLRVESAIPIFVGRDAIPVRSPVPLTSPGACVEPAAQETNLTVYRAAKMDYRAELAATSAPVSFDGLFDFTAPLVSLLRDSVEPPDYVYRPAPDLLRMHFEVWPSWYDAVNFTTPEFAKVCLRSTTARPQIVSLLSPGQPAPSRAVTPVDVTNDGACGLPAEPFPPPIYRRKFNAGHYVVLTALDDETSLAESIVPGVKGFVKRYSWRQLEPTPGNYDFSEIDADLATATRYGVQLVAQIEDKSFSDVLPTPDYLLAKTLPNIPGGYSVVRWDPYVVARYKALVAALGARFDGHPRFEGMATEESAHGLDEQAMAATQYTPERYRNVLIDELTAASASFPRSRVFWFMNFLWDGNHYMGEIVRKVAPLGVIVGGPDVLPDNSPLQLQAYPFYDGALGRLPLFAQVEPICYHHPHADPSYPTTYWTPDELFDFARDELHVSYMFWVRWRWRVYPDSYNWWDAIPVIGANPVFNR